MKNIQIIDGAINCTFSIFQATEKEFRLIFPERGQDVQFVEDLFKTKNRKEVTESLNRIWRRPIYKRDANGIHGTLFCQLGRYRKTFPGKREDSVLPSAVNEFQRRLFGK